MSASDPRGTDGGGIGREHTDGHEDGGISDRRRVSSAGAFVTFFKSLFGAGLLALPNVFNDVGLVLGVALYLAVACGCAASCCLLLRARELAEEECRRGRQMRRGQNGKPVSVLVKGIHRCSSSSSSCGTEEDEGESFEGGTTAGISPARYCCPEGASGRMGGASRVDREATALDKMRRTSGDHERAAARQHLVTYGDLASFLLGPTAASAARWTIILLQFLFSAGLVIVILENVSSLLHDRGGPTATPRDDVDGASTFFDEDDDEGPAVVVGNKWTLSRNGIGLALFPLVALALQIPWLQDMYLPSAFALAVYTVGVVGSSVLSAALEHNPPPSDMWALKWDGVPAFAGSAVYALEGINLALPTVHSMSDPSDAIPVVCGAVLCYAAVTVLFASVAYAGGLGGGAGTGRSAELCDVVTNCIGPPVLRVVLQVALSLALLLTVPVMLYPSTEMLEVMLTDRRRRRRQRRGGAGQRGAAGKWLGLIGGTSEGTALAGDVDIVGDSPPPPPLPEYGSLVGHFDAIEKDCGRHPSSCPSASSSSEVSFSPPLGEEDGDIFSQDKSPALRVALAVAVVSLATAMPSFTRFSGLVGAVGLTFAGFVLPPWLYARAMAEARLETTAPTRVGMGLLLTFAACNIVFGGLSSLRKISRGS